MINLRKWQRGFKQQMYQTINLNGRNGYEGKGVK